MSTGRITMVGTGGLIGRVLPAVLPAVNRSVRLRRLASRWVINGYAHAARPRPRPHSMAADYTTWPGLADRRFSGRHLPRAAADRAPAEPDLDAVEALFRREAFVPAHDTSVLFSFFAQWFTDGFLRTKWEEGPDRRFRENESNHEIDLNQIYGSGEAQARMLRDPGGGGRLDLDEHGFPAPLFEARDGAMRLRPRYEGLYSEANFARVYGSWSDEQLRHAGAVGLEHGNATIGQSVMNALWAREHNRTAAILAHAHPDWDDERLFQTARNVTIAVLLNIVIGDYIVHIAPAPLALEAPPGMAERERWYRTNHIPVEFALLYRWHDLVPDRIAVGDEVLEAAAQRRAGGTLKRLGLDAVLRAAGAQRAGRIGLSNTAPWLLAGGADVKRQSLIMGRRCGLASFNDYRRHYGLAPHQSFEALTGEREVAGRLRALYGEVERLEWFVGLFAEAHRPPAMMGALITRMVANDAFTQALTNPLLSEHVHNADTFSPRGLEIVRTTKRLAQVIVRNAGVGDERAVRFKVAPQA